MCSQHCFFIPQCTCTSVLLRGTAVACVWRQRGSSSVAGAVEKDGAHCGTTALPPTLTPLAGSTCPARMWSVPTHASLRSVPIISALSVLPAHASTSCQNVIISRYGEVCPAPSDGSSKRIVRHSAYTLKRCSLNLWKYLSAWDIVEKVVAT